MTSEAVFFLLSNLNSFLWGLCALFCPSYGGLSFLLPLTGKLCCHLAHHDPLRTVEGYIGSASPGVGRAKVHRRPDQGHVE